MQTVSATFLSSLASSHIRLNTVTHLNRLTGVSTPIEIEDGSVSLDVTQFIRRTLTLQLPSLESLFQLLSAPGGEITVTAGIKYGTTTELVPAGVYRVDVEDLDFVPSGQFPLTCPDRSLVVQRSRMGPNRASVPGNMVWQEIQRLVEGAFTSSYAPFPGWAQLDESATTPVGPQVYDSGDRDTIIAQYCKSNSLECYFDASGLAVLRPIPTSSTTAATWTTAMGRNGVMSAGNRARSFTDTRNVVVVTSTATDIQLSAIEVANTNNPLVDPLSSLGPLGRQVIDISGNYRTTAQMTAAGQTQLALYSAAQEQVTLSAIANPALDGWDQLIVVPLPSDLGTRPAETHVVQAYQLPLTNKTPAMSITGRAVINP